MGSSKSKQFGLPGNNRIWIELKWDESVSGTSNRVKVDMVVHTKYRIAGTWTCRLRIDGSTKVQQRVAMFWGGSSSGGSTTACTWTETYNYSGSKSINIEGGILNMSYYDASLGPGSTVTQTLLHSASPSLSSTNTPPPTPSISCSNPTYGGNYLSENSIDIELGHVTDPQHNTVTYAAYAEYMPPGGSSWLNAGDGNKCILYSTTSRHVSLDVTNYARGTRFRVWGKAIDSYGAESGYTRTIDNIYRNRTPNRVDGFSPHEGFFNDNFTINWNNPGDPDGNTPNFNLLLSKNDGAWTSVLANSSNRSYTQNIGGDSEGTTYKYCISTTDGLTESGYTYSGYYRKNTKPTTPTHIFPNSGYALGLTRLSWNASTDPDGVGINYYNVRINDVHIGTTSGASYDYTIPNGDAYNTAYKVSVQAVDKHNKPGEWGYATGHFYKASPPKPPAWIVPNENYHENFIDIEWENVSSNGLIVTYELSYRIDNGNWTIINNSLNRSKYRHDITNIHRGAKIDYRIMCQNSFGQNSPYAYREGYYRNRIPATPTIVSPKNNSTVYDTNLRMCFDIYDDADRQQQVLYVKCNDTLYNSRDNKDMFSRKDGTFVNKANIVFQAKGLIQGSNKITAYTNDQLINSSETSINLNVAPSNLSINKDGFIIADLFNSMREKINTLRESYGLSKVSYPSKIMTGVIIKMDHVTELRNSIIEIRNSINNHDSSNQNLDINVQWFSADGINYIYRQYIQQIIDMVNHI